MNEVTKIPPGAQPLTTQAPATPADIVLYAMQNGGSIDQIEKFMDLQRKWEADQARKAYVDAMAQFKLNPPQIVKDKLVEHSGISYKHATLGAVTEAIIAGLAQHGFSHRWDTKQDGPQITVTCIITHKLGHSETTALSSAKDDSGKKNSIQAVASAITYLQRYTLLAATGIATKDQADDDGRAAELDTSLADKWLGMVEIATSEAALTDVWNGAIKEIKAADDQHAYAEVKKAITARAAVLKGGVK